MTVQTQVRKPEDAVCPTRSSRHDVDRRLKPMSLGSPMIRNVRAVAPCEPIAGLIRKRIEASNLGGQGHNRRARMLAVFWGSSLLITYVLLGYPLLLWALARGRRPTPGTQETRFTVSVLIPVHNGAKFIREKLESVLGLDYPPELLDVLVVADGCTDETVSIVREYADRGVDVLVLPRGGKPAALNAAIPHLSGEIVLLTDVRQSLERESLKRLVARFEDPRDRSCQRGVAPPPRHFTG